MQLEVMHVLCKCWGSLLLPAAHDGLHNNLQIRTEGYKVGTPNAFIFPGKLMLNFLLSNEW